MFMICNTRLLCEFPSYPRGGGGGGATDSAVVASAIGGGGADASTVFSLPTLLPPFCLLFFLFFLPFLVAVVVASFGILSGGEFRLYFPRNTSSRRDCNVVTKDGSSALWKMTKPSFWNDSRSDCRDIVC